MATLVTRTPGTPEEPIEEPKINYLNAEWGWKSWLFTDRP